MPGGADLAAAGPAALVATLGTWWFVYIFKDARKFPKATRYGVYALIWLAYFVGVMLLVLRRGAA